MSPAELLGKHPIQKGEGWFNIAGRFMLRKPELRAWNCERTYWRTLSIYNYLVVTNTNLNVIMKVLSPNESSLSPFFISLAVLDNIVLRKLVHSRHYHSLVSKFYFKNFVTSYWSSLSSLWFIFHERKLFAVFHFAATVLPIAVLLSFQTWRDQRNLPWQPRAAARFWNGTAGQLSSHDSCSHEHVGY